MIKKGQVSIFFRTEQNFSVFYFECVIFRYTSILVYPRLFIVTSFNSDVRNCISFLSYLLRTSYIYHHPSSWRGERLNFFYQSWFLDIMRIHVNRENAIIPCVIKGNTTRSRHGFKTIKCIKISFDILVGSLY